jgi:hypothetical protein
MDVIDGVGLPGSCSTKVKYFKYRNFPSYLVVLKILFDASRFIKGLSHELGWAFDDING